MATSPKRTGMKRLGELLVGKGLISPWQLERALLAQQGTQEFLGAILVRNGWLTEEALLATLGEQLGIPSVHLEAERVDCGLAQHFPFAVLKEHTCFPLRVEGEQVVIAIANPLDAWAVSELETAVRFRKVQLVLAPVGEIRAALQRCATEALKSLEGPQETRDDGDA